MSQRPEDNGGVCRGLIGVCVGGGGSATICPYKNETHQTGLKVWAQSGFGFGSSSWKTGLEIISGWRLVERGEEGFVGRGGAAETLRSAPESPHTLQTGENGCKWDDHQAGFNYEFLIVSPTRKQLFPPQESLISQLPTHSSSAELISPRPPKGSRLLLPRLCFTSESLCGRC